MFIFPRREAGIIGKVRNQQTCGACWAFSTVETAESMHALKNGTLSLLSVQEVSLLDNYESFKISHD